MVDTVAVWRDVFTLLLACFAGNCSGFGSLRSYLSVTWNDCYGGYKSSLRPENQKR